MAFTYLVLVAKERKVKDGIANQIFLVWKKKEGEKIFPFLNFRFHVCISFLVSSLISCTPFPFACTLDSYITSEFSTVIYVWVCYHMSSIKKDVYTCRKEKKKLHRENRNNNNMFMA